MENFEKIPKVLQQMLILENDDTVFHIEDVLYLGEKLQIPVVFDIHHHDIHHPEDYSLQDIWGRVVQTWNHSPLPVKIHVSSPKEGKDDKRHHDFIDVTRLMSFLNDIKGTVDHVDVMIEAKMKDEALIQLMQDLKKRADCSLISEASIKL
ncbi:hypothetical protein [Anaerobacillus sp. CMMVII]|uniref:hypothetical protein n=1 Tax=Anaerobacillus sp. CMMVII TaxID=2755588 RepID=UPI0037BF2744